MARALASAGLKVGLAARNAEKLALLAAETGAETFSADASDPAAVAALFEVADARIGVPDVVLYNPSARAPSPIAELDPEAVRNIRPLRFRPSAAFWSCSRRPVE